MIARFVTEWQSIPWTPRARRLGNGIVTALVGVAIFAGPALMVGIVNRIVP